MNQFFAMPIRRVISPRTRRFISVSNNSTTADAEFGFHRHQFGRENLVGTVQPYDRHVFLSHGCPNSWTHNVESADATPRVLLLAINARKEQMKEKTKLTICNEDTDSSSRGDIMIFPDMIRYRQIRPCDYDKFVEQVLEKELEWKYKSSEKMMGSFIFVCSHGSRDKRCGVCGPDLVNRFKEEIKLCKFESRVYVKSSSHIGGHKYAGNVIIFNRNINGEVHGHWYGYVTPNDVPLLLEEHIGNGNTVDHLWRGQMGMSKDDQKKAHNLRLQTGG